MNKNSNRIYGSLLKQIRKQSGLTQKEFAFRSGLGLHAVRNLEQGASSLRLDRMNEAFRFFGYELIPERQKTGFSFRD
jgi:transcriptional regulator with XRE-family HTH domain